MNPLQSHYLGGMEEENLRKRGPRWDDEQERDEDDCEEFEKNQLLGED
jgi:hypothetical protein